MKSIGWTAYEDVNEMLVELLTAVRAILGEQFVGMYLYGSLVTGDFDEGISDIDFLVVGQRPLTDDLVQALKLMHGRFAASSSKWGDELEGYYLHQAAARRFVRSDERHPHKERGEALKVEPLAEDTIIMRYILWHKGLALAGPDVRELIDPVSGEALRQAVRDLFVGWWRPMLAAPEKLQTVGYRVYALLTMCRMLYTLRFAEIVSKRRAAQWALAELDERWRPLLATAVAWQGGELDNVAETLAFIGFVDSEI